MYIRQVIAAALIVTLTALAAPAHAGDEPIESNRSPYTPAFFNEELMEGRVLVLSFRSTGDEPWHVYGAEFFARYDPHAGLERLICDGRNRQYKPRIRTHELLPGDGLPQPRAARVGTRNDGSTHVAPYFWNPRTGRLHEEYWQRDRRRWRISVDGWMQESWPRLFADACPELTERIVAAGIPINEAQTNPYIWRMLAQDPTAPYTPGGDVPFQGLAASRSDSPFGWWHIYEKRDVPAPTIKGWPEDDLSEASPSDALVRELVAGHGKVLSDQSGRLHVLSVHPEGDELWSVDADGKVLDVGHLRFDAEARELVLDWENLPLDRGFRVRLGEDLPLVNTGRTHPAFELASHLASLDADQVLPFHGRQVTFRLNPDGTLLARRDAGDIAGSWRVSRGRIVLQVDGIPDRAGYPWAQLAELVGWTGVPMPDA